MKQSAKQIIQKIQWYHQQIQQKAIPKVAAYWQISLLLTDLEKNTFSIIAPLLKSTALPLIKLRYFTTFFPFWSETLLLLSWSHYLQLFRIKNKEARYFYFQKALEGQWTNQQLNRQIKTRFKERTLCTKQHNLNNRPFELRAPYYFEFIPTSVLPIHLEKQLEAQLVQHLPQLLLELGSGFTFAAQQQQLRLPSGKQFFVDLVFYQNLHKCFVIIDLKMTELSHQDIGQMDMYVRLYDEKWKKSTDNPTIGIILCPSKDPWLEKYSQLNVNPQLFASTWRI